MSKRYFTFLIVATIGAVFMNSCSKEKGCTDKSATNYSESAEEDDGSCRFGSTDSTDNNSEGTETADSTDTSSTDTTSTDTTTTGGGTKPSATSFRFKANGIDCGLTDGYSDQQHTLPHLIHLNTDKCNGDVYRPTLTLNFEGWVDIQPGTYNVAEGVAPASGEVTVSSAKYNFTNWTGTSGKVHVTTNDEDTSKIDIELDAINMSNDTPGDTLNPANDELSGWIIKI